MSEPIYSDDELVEHFQAGTLLEIMDSDRDADEPESQLNHLVRLHNEGRIALLSALDTPAFEALGGSRFFEIQQVYCKAVPQLQAPVADMMAAVAALVKKGGRDYAAGFPYNAFKQWLDLDPAKARAIIAATDAGETIDPHFVAISLEVLMDTVEANRLIANSEGEPRIAALSALGRMKPADANASQAALDSLLPYVASPYDENTRFAAINAVFNFLRHSPELAGPAISEVIRAVADEPSNETRFALTQALWLQGKLFDREAVEAALEIAHGGDFSNKGLVDMLDGALQQMLVTPERDLALDFLTDALAAAGTQLTLKALDSVSHRLANEQRADQFPLAVRWFVTADRTLCEDINHILTHGRDRDEPFDASMAGMGLSPGQMVIVCHKAIGFVMLQPVITASVIVAALRAGEATIENALIELLLHGVLINYQGEARDYLRQIEKVDPAYKAVRKALKLGDGYAKGAHIETPIKELWPSDYQRHLATMKRHDLGREIRKRADEQSIFAKLARRSTLLYGNKSVSYFAGADKPPVTMELKPMGFGVPMPRMDLVDPVGYDWMMRVFRASKPQ